MISTTKPIVVEVDDPSDEKVSTTYIRDPSGTWIWISVIYRTNKW